MEDKQKNQDCNEKPEVFSVKQGEQGWEFSRRDFITAMGVSAAAITVAGCSGSKLFAPKSTETPTPSATPTNTVTPTATNTPTSTPTVTPTATPTPLPAINPEQCADPRTHTDEINYLEITENGKWMVSGGKDKYVKVWSLPSVGLVGAVNITKGVEKISISPDSSELAILDSNNVIHVYAMPTCEWVFDVEADSYSFSFSPDGKYIIALQRQDVANKKISTFSAKDGALVNTYSDVTRTTNEILEIDPEQKMAVLAGGLKEIDWYAYEDFTKLDSFLSEWNVVAVKFSADGKSLFIQVKDEKIIQLELENKEIVNQFLCLSGFTLSRDGSLLILGEEKDLIHIWSIPYQTYTESHKSNISYSTAIAINPDNRILAAGNEKGQIYLWSLPSWNLFSCPIDLDATSDEVEGVTYETTSSTGETITYTLPCGAPVPAGAVCVCNCVTGSVCSCVGYVSCSCDGYSPCSCVGHVTGGSHYWYPD